MFAYQSAYRKYNSSETALLRVQNDILVTSDSGHSTALFLDLSAAFDTRPINHYILLHRFQTVVVSNSKSQGVLLEIGIPQGCVERAFILFHHPTSLHHLQIPWYPQSFLCR